MGRKYLFSGRVQGVGFRYTTKQFAIAKNLQGTVRNLSDGRVELVTNASEAECETLLSQLRNHFNGNISAIEEADCECGSLPETFRIIS